MLNLPTLYCLLYPLIKFFWLSVALLFMPFLVFSHTDESVMPTQILINGNDDSTPIHVFENLPVGAFIGTLTSSNTSNPTSTHSYTFISGSNDNHRYRIIGDQLFTAEIFDAEASGSHRIEIRSTDNSNLFIERSFTIIIENLDIEVAPVTSSCSYTLSPPIREIDCGGTATTVTGTTTSSLTFSSFGVHQVLWEFSCPSSTEVYHVIQEVTIRDTDPPLAPSLGSLNGFCSVTLIPPITTDACDGIITGTTTGSLVITAVGTQTIIWAFTDSSGNFTTANQIVVVNPVINIDEEFIRENDIVPISCTGGNDGSIKIPEDPLQFRNRIMGDANEIRQVDHLVLEYQPSVSDIYNFRLNGVDYSYIVTPSSFGGPAQTPREVAEAIINQINTISTEVTASLTATSTIVITANRPGTPFNLDLQPINTSGLADINHVNIIPNQTSGYTYKWSGPNGFTSSQLQIENLIAGTYTFEVSINGCNTATSQFVVTEPSPVVLDTNFCNGSFELNISGGVSPYTINLFDRNGALIETLITNEGELFTNLTPGSNYLVEVIDNQCPVSVQRAIEFPFEIDFDASIPVLVNDFCNDSEGEGYIELGGNAGGESFSGGSNRYSYSWVGPNFRANTRDIYNLNPGVYTVTVTDDELGCQHRESFEIFSVNPIIIEATSQTIFNSQNKIELACEGDKTGIIEVTVRGGAGNYVYSWTKNGNTLIGENQPYIENLGVGIYEITVRDETPSGTPTDIEPCVVTRSFEVVAPEELSFFVNDNVTNLQICPGENATTSYEIEIFGGTPPFTVISTAENGTKIETEVNSSRKNTITGLNPGKDGNTYSIVVTDSNACESQSTSSTLTFESIEAVTFRYTVEQIDCVAGTLGSIQLNVVSGNLKNEETIQVNWKSIGVDIYDTWANGKGALQNISTGGTYQVIVTQGNCELYRSENIVITDINNNQLYLNDIQIEGGGCNGSEGSIILDIAGGYPPISIEWEVYRAVTSVISGTGSSSDTTATSFQWVSLPQYANNAAALGLELGTYRATVQDSSSRTSSEICSSPQRTPNIVIGSSVFELTNFQIIQENACEADNAEINFSIRNTLPNPNNIEYSPQITLDGNNPGSNLIALGNQNYKIINISEGNHTLNITTGTTSAVLGNFSSCAIAHPFVIEAQETIQYTGETQINLSACDSNTELAIDVNLITGGTPYVINGESVYDFSWIYTPEEQSDPNVGTQNFVGDKIINPAPGSYELIISDSENCSTDPIVFTVTQDEGFEPFIVSGALKESSGTTSVTQIDLVKALPPNCSGNQSNGQIGIAISGGLNPYVIEWYREEVSTVSGTTTNYVQILEAQNRTHLQNLRAGNYKLIIRSQNVDCEQNALQTNNRYYEEIIKVPNSDELRLIDGPYIDEDLCKGLPGRIILELFDNDQSDLSFYYNNEILTVDTDRSVEDSRVIVLFVENPVNDAELVITNQEGCSLSSKIQIDDLSVPEFEFSSPTLQFENTILAKEEIEFRNISTGFYAYSTWNFGDGTQSQDIPRTETASPVLHAYGISGTYLVSLRNYSSSGCYEETVKQIVVGSGYNIIAPNAFSPNGDLVNDKYRVLFSGFKKVNFNIYDHIGNLLHSEEVEEEDPVSISSLELQGWGGSNAPKNSPYFIYHFSGIMISDETEIIRSGTFVLIP